MGAALGRGDGMDLIDDEPPDRREDPPRCAGEDEVERLGGGDEDVRRVALHRPAHLGRRGAGADGGSYIRRDGAGRLDLVADTDEWRAKVAVDVVGERFQRRHIEGATPLRLGRRRLRRKAIEAPQECGQRLATAGGRGHEHVAARGDLTPAALLDLGRLRESIAKPVPGRRCKEVENVPHATNFDRFPTYKQVFVVKIASDLDAQRFREVMASFPSGVVVLTAFGEDSLPRGLTVSAFCAVSLEPRLALACIDKTSNTLPALQHAGGYAVCTLKETIEAGDHWILIGNVIEGDHDTSRSPMIFSRRGYFGI